MPGPRLSELIAAADVLAPGLSTPIDAVMIELLRPQAAFNHAVVDVLGRWPQMGGSPVDIEREQKHLAKLAAAPRHITSHRKGLEGELVAGTKRVLVPLAERALSRWSAAQTELNRARISRRAGAVPDVPKMPWVKPWLERQARFDRLLNEELPGLLVLNSYQAVYERVGSRKSVLPPPREDPTVPNGWVLWKAEGVEVRQGAVAALLEQSAGVDLLYADEDHRDATGRRYAPFFKPGWSRELALERDLLGGVVLARMSVAKGPTPLDWALALPPGRIRRVAKVLSHRLDDPDPLPHFEAVERALKPGERIERHAHGLRAILKAPPSERARLDHRPVSRQARVAAPALRVPSRGTRRA